MRATDLKHLAGVADLAKLDFGTPTIMLHTTPTHLVSTFEATYSAGRRRIIRPGDVPDLRIDVPAERFREVCALYEDATDVSVRPLDTRVRLVGKKSHAMEVLLLPPDLTRRDYDGETFPIVATCKRSALLDEIGIAEKYTARNVSNAMLTGVRLTVSETDITVQAMNGFSVLYRATIPCTNTQRQTLRVIVPAVDLLAGLKVVGEEEITLGILGEGARIVLQGRDAWFQCVTLNGLWPNTDALTEDVTDEATVKLSREQIKGAVAAAKIFEAAANIEIGKRGTSAVLRTTPSQSGQYVVPVAATPNLPDSTWFDMGDLNVLVDVAANVTLHIPHEPTRMAYVHEGNREAWLSRKYVTLSTPEVQR